MRGVFDDFSFWEIVKIFIEAGVTVLGLRVILSALIILIP